MCGQYKADQDMGWENEGGAVPPVTLFSEQPGALSAVAQMLMALVAFLQPLAANPTQESNRAAHIGSELVKLVSGEAEAEYRALSLIRSGGGSNADFAELLADFAYEYDRDGFESEFARAQSSPSRGFSLNG